MIKRTVLESPRKFSVFSFGIGHRVLLLRSGKTDTAKTRIEVLFKDVRAIEIRMIFEGVSISEVAADYLHGFRSNPAAVMQAGHRVYAVAGSGWDGYIVGGAVFIKEDNREFFDPSSFSSLNP